MLIRNGQPIRVLALGSSGGGSGIAGGTTINFHDEANQLIAVNSVKAGGKIYNPFDEIWVDDSSAHIRFPFTATEDTVINAFVSGIRYFDLNHLTIWTADALSTLNLNDHSCNFNDNRDTWTCHISMSSDIPIDVTDVAEIAFHFSELTITGHTILGVFLSEYQKQSLGSVNYWNDASCSAHGFYNVVESINQSNAENAIIVDVSEMSGNYYIGVCATTGVNELPMLNFYNCKNYQSGALDFTLEEIILR